MQLIKTHTKFVQDVQYSPNGDHFASVGSDSKVFLYDGKTGETIGEFSSTGGHKGSIVRINPTIKHPFAHPQMIPDGMQLEFG